MLFFSQQFSKFVVHIYDILRIMSLQEIYSDEKKLIEVSRNGITKRIFLEIIKATGLSAVGFASAVHVTPRTIERKNGDEMISPESSERAILIGKLYYKGEQVFRDKKKFRDWMDKVNFSLEGKKPKEMLDTITGIGILNDILLRIEYGIVA